MLENLIQLVKEHAGEAIINNPAINNRDNDAAIETTANGIMDGLKNHLGSGGLSGLTSMLQGGNSGTNSLIQSITTEVTSGLASKFGISQQVANGIANSLIPIVVNKFLSKTKDPNDNSFNVEGIMGAIGGQGGIQSLLGKLF